MTNVPLTDENISSMVLHNGIKPRRSKGVFCDENGKAFFRTFYKTSRSENGRTKCKIIGFDPNKDERIFSRSQFEILNGLFLREMLQKSGLDGTGNKEQLINRLVNSHSKEF